MLYASLADASLADASPADASPADASPADASPGGQSAASCDLLLPLASSPSCMPAAPSSEPVSGLLMLLWCHHRYQAIKETCTASPFHKIGISQRTTSTHSINPWASSLSR